MGSRKLYAVKFSEVKGKGKGKEICPVSKTMKQYYTLGCATDSDEDIAVRSKHNQEIMKEISSLRLDIKQMLSLMKVMKLPPGLYIQLKETFKCHICHASPITSYLYPLLQKPIRL